MCGFSHPFRRSPERDQNLHELRITVTGVAQLAE
jgi:hypothetical protein